MSGSLGPFTFTDRVIGQQVLQLTGSDAHHVHGGYDLQPWSAATGQV